VTAAFAAARPVAMAFSRAFTLLGENGCGQLAKMVNQICIAGLVQGLSEAIAFGQQAGLDMNQVLDVIGKGAAQSWQLDNRGKTMVADQFDFGFAVDWMRKDLGLVTRRGQAQRRTTARYRIGRPVLCRCASHGRTPLGYLQPHQAAEEDQRVIRACRTRGRGMATETAPTLLP
jgi:3-hydroxyisobutyrate dehydrogenase-like beta-hydroxyacid dehydrogenase